MNLKSRSLLEAAAWAANDKVQLQIGPLRFTASDDEAIAFARLLVDAVDKLRADKSAAT